MLSYRTPSRQHTRIELPAPRLRVECQRLGCARLTTFGLFAPAGGFCEPCRQELRITKFVRWLLGG